MNNSQRFLRYFRFFNLLFGRCSGTGLTTRFRVGLFRVLTLVAGLAILASASHAQDTRAAGATASAERSAADLVEAAREAARNDRNRESADFFTDAIRLAPGRRQELLQEFADQLTYSGRAPQAVPLYREGLASGEALNPEGRLRMLKGLGLALLWSNQPGKARIVYEDLLRMQPADQGSWRNLGRALSWNGRQREAIAVLQKLLHAYPDDQEARVALAQARAWMGRPDLAQVALEGMDANARDDAKQLRSDLARALAPRTRAESQRSTQSDQLDIESARLTHEVSFDHGLGTLGARLEKLKFERDDGADSARLSTPMIRGRYRFNDAVELNGELGNLRIEPRASEALNRFVYSVWLTVWPSDIVRVDLSSNRASLDNLRSLHLGLTATQNGVSLELTPSERQRYAIRLDRGLYSDGNRRWSNQAEGEYRWLAHPDLWLGLRHSQMAFSQLLNNGYFNPKEFRSDQLTLRLAHRFGGDKGRWDFSAFGAVGREHANPDGSKPTYDVSAVTGWRMDERTRLEARVQRFSSRTASSSGFERTTFSLNLERSW
jgi:hypothetical protein